MKVYATPHIGATADSVATLVNGSVSFDLAGVIHDAGLGDPDVVPTVAWSQVSGPRPAAIDDAGALAPTVTADRNGDYVFELRVNNGKLSAAAQVGVTVNQAPTVDAGPATSVVLPQAAMLDATVGDDGLPHDPGHVALQWTQASGPGLAIFEDATADRTQARFSLPGTYRLEISADDGAAMSSDTVGIDVHRPPRIGEDLIVHYRFDAGEGLVVADVAGGEPPLDLDIAEGSPVTWVAGGLQLTGAAPLTAAATAQRVLDAMSSHGGTLEAVVTPGEGMTFRRSVARIVVIRDERGPIVSLSQDGHGMRGALHFGGQRRRTSQSVGAALAGPTDRVQVAYTFDPAVREVRLYLNGFEAAVGSYGGTWPPGGSTAPALVLADDSGGTDWLGTFHAVAVYGRVLSAREVLTNYYADIG